MSDPQPFEIIPPIGNDPDDRMCQVHDFVVPILDRLLCDALAAGWQPHELLLSVMTPAVRQSIETLGLDLTRECIATMIGTFGSEPAQAISSATN